jgi:cystathionine beta-lyase/cystathionine gamma-synthase
MQLVDIEMVASVVAEANARRAEDERIVTIIDNTFATPFCQRPLTMGIDMVVHSLTKNLGGFGADMGGAVIGPRSKETELLLFRKDFGGSLSPKAAWQIQVFGIPTLALRMERQQQSALAVADFLGSHPKVASVKYPGLRSFAQIELAQKQMRDIDGNFAPGSVLYFELAGDPAQSFARAKALADYIASNALSVTLAVSLGQIRTLLQHPASMTHSALSPDDQAKAGISPGGLRLSLGIEDVRDIISDLDAALSAVT